MSDRKNIDRLFQEKFKDFEVTPDELVWKKIKAHQKEKKKRVLILPFWYRVAGVAIFIALMSGISYIYFENNSLQNTTITDTDNDINKEVIDTSNDVIEPIKRKEVVVTSEKQESLLTIDNVEKSTSHKIVSTKKNQKHPFLKEQAPIKESKLTHTNHSSDVLDENSTTRSTSSSNTITFDQSRLKSNEVKEEMAAKETTNIPQKEKNNLINQPMIDRNSDISTVDQKTTSPTEDMAQVNQKDKKSIFDAIAEEEKIVKQKTNDSKKWNIAPNVAPVYYNTIGNASSIDNQFSDNDKNGQVNMSYGLQVSYAINKRVTIRSGINNVDLGYQTENVGFTPSASSQQLQAIDYNTTSDIILISDIENPKIITEARKNPNTPEQNSGLLNQSINYLEVPLEMKFALVDKKFDVNMIGGISTLFLQKNKIYIETGDFETLIGEANNLNNVSFSGNIGLGIDYELSDHFEINLEPIFKYQFNAFNEATNFKPYYFGIYTGINIKF